VPVFAIGRTGPAGLLDVESERVNGFGEEDRDRLEKCASLLSPLWET
jgi:putative methionine-R-sulfoxide reductase with GAF domain